jgi:multisubunit Na+/H+ antiporter MnhB subunit
MTGMTIIVKTVAEWIKGFILFYGVYIVLQGHLSPGGGFAGGVIIACSFIMMELAFGKDQARKELSQHGSHLLDEYGALAILFMGLIGFFLPDMPFFSNVLLHTPFQAPFHILSAGSIPLINLAIGLKVGTGLYSVYTHLSRYDPVLQEDE